jgi:hypothetical protein
MLQRLGRMVLGLALAMIFAGQTALASDLCGRNAHVVVVSHDGSHAVSPCHDGVKAQGLPRTMSPSPPHHGEGHASPVHEDADHDACECAAAATSCLANAHALTSASVRPWAWLPLQPVMFVSTERVPDGPPPKA